MTLGRLVPAALALSLVPLAPCRAQAQCPPRCDRVSLRALALGNAPELDAVEADVSFERARLEEARFSALDLGRVRLELAPTAFRRGDLLHSEGADVSFSDDMGLWLRFSAEAALSITPWWTIAEYWRAARSSVEMSESEAQRQRAATLLAVDLALIDVQLHSALLATLRRARRAIQRAHDHIDHLLEEDLPGAVEADRLRLVVVLSDLDARIVQARAARRRARARLRRLTGMRRTVAFTVPPLPESPPPEQPLEWHLETARRLRPEIPLGVAGLAAARAIVRARQSELVPLLAIGGSYGSRTTPVVDDQRNPFANDPWNGYGPGYGLVYRWDPDLGRRAARLARARADVARAQALRRYALGGIAYEVEVAFSSVREAQEQLETRRRGRDVASRRFEALIEEQRSGETPARELAEAARDWLASEVGVLGAMARLLQSHARLAQADGRSLSEPAE